MKKLVYAAIALGALYYFKPGLFDQIPGIPHSAKSQGVVLFTFPDCGRYCDDAKALLDKKGVIYEHYDVKNDPEGEAKWRRMGGGTAFPITHIGGERLDGFHRTKYTHALASVYGVGMLEGSQRHVVEGNMQKYGDKTVVMYATEWCGYCAKARKFFTDKGIAYTELDAEKDANARRQYLALDSRGYPLIYVGTHRFEGWGPATGKAVREQL